MSMDHDADRRGKSRDTNTPDKILKSKPATSPSEGPADSFDLTQDIELPLANRELGWLAFNRRVLALCQDASVPLLERLRFLCISSNNLDEFFEVRVAGLKQKIQGGVEGAGVDGMSPQQAFNAITTETREFVERQYAILNEHLFPELLNEGVEFLRRDTWSKELRDWIKDYFDRQIAPVLSPLGLDPAHPFPRLTNKSLAFIIDLRGTDAFGRAVGYALIRAPRSLPRVIAVPEDICGRSHGFVFLSSIIHSEATSLFNGMTSAGCFQFKVTRNSELYVSEEEVANLRRALETELLQRNFGSAVRLEVAADCPPRIVKFLQQNFSLTEQDVYKVNGPVNLNRLGSVPDQIDRPDLKYRPFHPQIAPEYGERSNIFDVIRQKHTVVLHHPYQSYAPVIELMKQAAADSNVLAIKQTLYRTGNESVFVDHLMEASRAGKDVTVVIELFARFDEEANIGLASRLQEAGIQVVYGVVGFKTHAKMLLIVRREKGKLVHYGHVGTGNYHATTARMYTDVSVLTCKNHVTKDIQRVFNQLTGLGKTRNLKEIVQSPFALQQFIIEKIRLEQSICESGGQGHVMARMNSLLDPDVIAALYSASQAGVKIELIVRGTCALKSQVIGLSENIRVVSVLGRFLEHSRVFYFGGGGEETLYISSADWMPRNFLKRVEIAVPLEGEDLKCVKEECLIFYLRDNTSSWEQNADGGYTRVSPGDHPFSAQRALLKKHSDSTHGVIDT